ncbi:MAG: MFS transporter [Rikenellaceae bacterium]
MSSKITLNAESQRKIRIAVFIYFFLFGLCFASWASRIPEIKTALQLDDAAWGMMLLMIPMGQLIGMTFSGWLISKVGSHKISIIAVFGYAISLIAIGISPVKSLFVASLIIFGFFGNFCNIAINTQAVVIENFYQKQIMASFHGGWSFAGLCGALIGLSMTILRVPTPIHFSAVALIVCTIAVVKYKYLQNDALSGSKSSEDESKPNKIKFENFLLWLGIIGFVGWATEGTMADWNGVFLQQVVGVDERFTPIGLTAYMITMTVGRFMMDRAVSRFGRRVVLSACGAAIFIGMFIAAIVPTFVMTIIGFMIVGFGACGVIPIIYSAAGENTKIHTGRAITIVSTISFAGFLFGPPIIGYVSDLTNLRYAFALVGVLGLLAWITSLQLQVLRSKKQP